MTAPILTRKCSGCKLDQPADNFPPARNGIDRWSDRCRGCTAGAKKRRLRNEWLLRKYGITLEEYERLLARQGGRCPVCHRGAAEWKGKRSFPVDHCHKTGRVRGVLCPVCNAALAYLGDDLEAATRLVNYLRFPSGQVLDDAFRRSAPLPRRYPLRLCHAVVVRYVLPDGRRASKGDPGAAPVRHQTKTFYASAGSRIVSLRTADRAEAERRLQSLATKLDSHDATVSATDAGDWPQVLSD